MKVINFLKRIIVYCIGLFVLSIGVCFSIKSNLGTSPVSSFQYVLSIVANIDIGVATTIVCTLWVIVQFFLFGKDYRKKELLQLFSSVIFGMFMSLGSLATNFIPMPSNYVLQLVYCIVGLCFVSVGLFLYINANILALPSEGVMQGIMFRFKKPMHTAKIMNDVTIVVISIIISLVFLGRVVGIREGTIISAIATGICLKFVTKLLKKHLNKFFGK